MKIYETRIIKKETEIYKPVTKLACIGASVNDEDVEFGEILTLEDEKALVFNPPLEEGDKLIVKFETDLNKAFTKSKYGKGAIYKMYSTYVKFKVNTNYKFHLEYDEKYNFVFTSKYDPFFTTIKTIRNDTGTLFENIKDEVIAEVIFDNSIYVMNKIGEDTDVLDEGTPLYVKNFVRYKTDIDLCYAVYLSKTGKMGNFKKKLADLDVSSEVKLPVLTDMLSRFRELLKPNEDLLEGENADYTMAFVKAKSTTYPVNTRGVF